MNLKPIVKLMNFHALLRVDSAKRRAERHLALERELSAMLDLVMNNRNFLLDKRLFRPDPEKPAIRVYVGSDFGFCGAFNHRVEQAMREDVGSFKIVVGRKLSLAGVDNVIFHCEQQAYEDELDEIHDMLVEAIAHGDCSAVDLVYNRYANASTIELVQQNIFPLDHAEHEGDRFDPERFSDDYVVEGDINRILIDLVVSYLDYELRIAQDSSFASENIMRQDVTSRSLDKIDEIEDERLVLERKERRRREFVKVFSSYTGMERNHS